MAHADNTFFTADSHLDHDAIRIHCGRPHMTLDEMNQAIVDNWNEVVPKRNSLVYILGDFAWKNHAKWFHKLNGKKVLIIGNHDHMNQKCYSLFREVIPLKDIKVEKVKVTLCHYAMMTWNCKHWGAWHLYGHSHGRLPHNDLAMDVGMDTNNYKPYSWEQIKQIMVPKADKLVFHYNPEAVGLKRVNPNYGFVVCPGPELGKVEVKPFHGTQTSNDSYVLNIQTDKKDLYIKFIGEEHGFCYGIKWKDNTMEKTTYGRNLTSNFV